MYDSSERIFPQKIGYAVYKAKSLIDHYYSPTFPRPLYFAKEIIGGDTDADTVVEYSLWYDADISHLYELEHLWVYMNSGEVVAVEGSRHGLISSFSHEASIYVEPGKHGHFQTALTDRLKSYLTYCCQKPGKDGLSLDTITAPELLAFRGTLTTQYEVDSYIEKTITYLSKYTFTPSFEFTKEYIPDAHMFVPWATLKEYIEDYLLKQLNSLT